MSRALQAISTKYYAESGLSNTKRTSKEEIDMIVETSNGDIRSAVMALQFLCSLDTNSHFNAKGKSGRRKKQGGGTTRAL